MMMKVSVAVCNTIVQPISLVNISVLTTTLCSRQIGLEYQPYLDSIYPRGKATHYTPTRNAR